MDYYTTIGDVITFDTIYKTNNIHKSIGLFVGYNNYSNTVVFAATLLCDEIIPSFEWMFETFLKVMDEKKTYNTF